MQFFVDMLKKIFVFPLFLFIISPVIYSQTPDTLRRKLHEVEVTTKYNPAIPIIKKAIQNRNENGQFSNDYFTFTSYQKMIFTGDINKDSTLFNFEKSHLFFTESVTKNYFKKPSISYEKVIAHHTAGLKDPIASIFLAKQQTINFYERDFLEIFEANYVNPISKSALTIYDFRLEENIFQEEDTLFVISFKPQKNAHFKSLIGKIWITSQNFAFTKIEVAPFDKALSSSFKLKQEYEKQPNNTYFLKDMSFKCVFFKIGVPTEKGTARVNAVLLSEKKISEIDYETCLRNRDFGVVDIEEELESTATQKHILETYRLTELTEKELNTIKFMDSLIKPYKPDKLLESLKILISGKVPARFVSIDVMQILHFNSTENVRLGLGVYTNNRLSKVINFGGFFGYGFKDKTWKWGGEFGFNIIRSRDCKITFQYYSNLIESGKTDFYNRDYTLFSGEFYRSWLFEQFYRSNALGISAQSRITRWLTGYVSTFYSVNKTLFNYSFQKTFLDETPTTYSFDDFYVKIGVRLAFRERFWGADKYYFYSVSPYPVLIIQYSKGIKGMVNSSFNYNRIDLKVQYRKNWKILGFTNLTLYAGYIDRPLPAPLLLNQRAGYYSIGIDGAEQFGVMRANEFLSDKYVSLFIRHNFGRMTQNKKFSPRIIVCQSIGFGKLNNLSDHIGMNIKTMEKGYFESGVMINDLLVIKGLLSFGVGAFARYGTYYLPKPHYKTIDNFAFKVSFRVPFER